MVWTFDKLVDLLRYLALLAFDLAGFVAAGFIIYYGVRMGLARDNATEFASAKSGLIKAALGLMVIAGVWTIIATVRGAVGSIGN